MKKFFIVLCMVLMVTSVNVGFAEEYEAEYPKIIFENKTDVTKVKAGETFDFNLTIKNVGDESAKYVTLINSDKEAPVYWETAVSLTLKLILISLFPPGEIL